jgi:hypothetical protein
MRFSESTLAAVATPDLGDPTKSGGNAIAAVDVPMSGLSETEHSAQLRRALTASTVGTTIEWYDFLLYGQVMGLVFDKLFFPQSDPPGRRRGRAAEFRCRQVGQIVFKSLIYSIFSTLRGCLSGAEKGFSGLTGKSPTGPSMARGAIARRQALPHIGEREISSGAICRRLRKSSNCPS